MSTTITGSIVRKKPRISVTSGPTSTTRAKLTRLKLQDLLENLGDGFNVYFQPPPNFQMIYPAIVYNRDYLITDYADNLPYNNKFRWQITVIDMNPDSPLHDLLMAMPLMKYVRHYTTEQLNHDIYDVYF